MLAQSFAEWGSTTVIEHAAHGWKESPLACAVLHNQKRLNLRWLRSKPTSAIRLPLIAINAAKYNETLIIIFLFLPISLEVQVKFALQLNSKQNNENKSRWNTVEVSSILSAISLLCTVINVEWHQNAQRRLIPLLWTYFHFCFLFFSFQYRRLITVHVRPGTFFEKLSAQLP